VAAQRRELEAAEAGALATTRGEIAALRRKLDDQAAVPSPQGHAGALLVVEKHRAEQASLLERAKELGADEAREEFRVRVRELEADRDRRTHALEEMLAEAQRHAHAERSYLHDRHGGNMAEAERALVLAQLERDRAISDLQQRLSGQLADEAARLEGLAEANQRFQHEIEDLSSQWHRELEAERQLRADILKAGEVPLGSPDLEVRRLERELREAKGELPELESEIAVLRGELTRLRAKLENEGAIARVASEQLEANRNLLARAEKALREARDAASPPDDAPPELRVPPESQPPT
jgi:hypothetical protein